MASSDLEQWVNLERKKDFVVDEIPSEERLGQAIKFECKFTKANPATFKLRVVPLGDHASYGKQELARNANFKLRTIGAKAKPEGKEIELEVEYALPCAGGNRFQIEAKHDGKVVKSTKVLAARRRLFYQVLSMQGVEPLDLSGLEKDCWDESKNYFIRLKEKGPRGVVKFIHTLHKENFDDLFQQAKYAYGIDHLRPYSFVIVFANFIAAWGALKVERDVDLELPGRVFSRGPGKPITITLEDHIWYGMDSNHDRDRTWLVENHSQFFASDGTNGTIPDDWLEVVGPPEHPLGGYKTIVIKPGPELQRRFTSNRGVLKVRLKVGVITGFIVGCDHSEYNVLVIARHSGFEPMAEHVLRQAHESTLRHEMGHRIGMVTDGTGCLPDGPATLYGVVPGDDRGHKGPHCSKGATYSLPSKKWSGSPGCVMFGAMGIKSGTGAHELSPKEFCNECEKIVRKLDLDPRHIAGFKRSVRDF